MAVCLAAGLAPRVAPDGEGVGSRGVRSTQSCSGATARKCRVGRPSQVVRTFRRAKKLVLLVPDRGTWQLLPASHRIDSGGISLPADRHRNAKRAWIVGQVRFIAGRLVQCLSATHAPAPTSFKRVAPLRECSQARSRSSHRRSGTMTCKVMGMGVQW
jgi:hypothetical protein